MPSQIYSTQAAYAKDMRTWKADIETWQKWALEEKDPVMKAFYMRTLKRSMDQFFGELQEVYVQTSEISRLNYNIWCDDMPPGFETPEKTPSK